MTAFINTILLIVNIISFAATVLFAIFGVYEQIMGPADAEKLLKKLHVPLSYNQALINAFKVQQEPKQPKPIGFKSNNKQSKKRKKNEDKSKTN